MDYGTQGQIQIYEVGARRLYVKTGTRNFAISEDDVTPEELLCIAKDIAARNARRSQPQGGVASSADQGKPAAA